MTENRKNCASCESTSCGAKQRKEGETDEAYGARMSLLKNLCGVRHKVLVMSGKGGVGKSTVAVNLAAALGASGMKVGLLDSDFHGPSVPRLMGLSDAALSFREGAIVPPSVGNVKVMSVQFMLPGKDDAVIWRGPMKMGALRQFLRDVDWGELDVMVIDCPPGTGDEPLSVIQSIPEPDGAVIVSTPQQVALDAVRRSVNFCRRMRLSVIGVVENMSGFACPGCGLVSKVFGAGGAEEMAASMGVPFLGGVPIDPAMVVSGDEGRPTVLSEIPSAAGTALKAVSGKVAAFLQSRQHPLAASCT